MNYSAPHIPLEPLPMLRALLPFIAGIVVAAHVTLPTFLLWAGFLFCGAMALTFRSSLYTLIALFMFGWGVTQSQATPSDNLPRGIRSEFALTIDDANTATITAYRTDNGEWRRANTALILHTDSALILRTGDRLVVRSYLNDLPDGSYGQLMLRRGYAGRMWLSERQIVTRREEVGATLHTMACERLQQLGLQPKEQALCAAMSAGDRRGLTPELRRAYARSGTSHLLAVSGLHVGIIFMLVNVLLWWLPALHRGHIIRNIIAIALIWLYATTSGLSPSVVRAAMMFSALQLSLASASTYTSGNILAATAFAMLIYNTNYLYDISFQLSFTAVAAILAWGVPLYGRLHTSYRLLNLLISSIVISLTAAIATAPLAAHTFGIVSIAGFIINPLVIPLASVVVLTSVTWIIVPLDILSHVIRPITNAVASSLNQIVGWSAAWPYGAFEWHPTTIQVVVIYSVMICITIVVWRQKPKKSISLLK